VEMMAYRETAMRHGERWLVRKKIGINQELRKGKGDASELEAKLAILLDVMGERRALAMRLDERLQGLSERERGLEGKMAAIEEQIRLRTAALQKKKALVKKHLSGLKVEMEAEKAKAGMLEEIGKNGLAESKHERAFWDRLWEG